MSRTRNRLGRRVSRMAKLSPREAVKIYQVSRATLTKALQDGTVSAEKTDAGHWRIDSAELARVYHPREPQKAVRRTNPDQVIRDSPDHTTVSEATEMAVKLARAEAALEAEREKTALLERHVADLRRMLPAPEAPPPRRRWWPF